MSSILHRIQTDQFLRRLFPEERSERCRLCGRVRVFRSLFFPHLIFFRSVVRSQLFGLRRLPFRLVSDSGRRDATGDGQTKTVIFKYFYYLDRAMVSRIQIGPEPEPSAVLYCRRSSSRGLVSPPGTIMVLAHFFVNRGVRCTLLHMRILRYDLLPPRGIGLMWSPLKDFASASIGRCLFAVNSLICGWLYFTYFNNIFYMRYTEYCNIFNTIHFCRFKIALFTLYFYP